MRYILLEISRRTIALYTNKGDGTRTFQPYGEGQTLPLALCYLNGEYHTGVFAQQQKEYGSQDAYDNLFAATRTNCMCHEIQSRDFVPHAVRLNIAQICRDYFLIDSLSQASELTIVLLFGIDVNDAEREMLSDALRADGYSDIIIADRAKRATLSTLQMNFDELSRNKAALIIKSDNADLSVKCVSTVDGHTFVEKVLVGKGKDPRFQFGIDQLWAGVESQTYSSKEKELPYLVQALRSFIASNNLELTNIELSDGNYSTFLSRSMYDNYVSNDTASSTDFVSILKNGKVSPADCYVILENYASGNKFFKDSLTQFSPIIDEDSSLRKEIRDLIMRDILDGRPLNFYNINAMKQAERQRQLDEERERQEALRAKEEQEEIERKKTETPTAFVEEKKETGPNMQSFDGSRKFIIKSKVNKSGFFLSKKILISIEVEIEGDKKLPCNCALTIDSQNYKSYREETKFEDMEKGDSGPFRFGPYNVPLSGIDKNAKIVYVHVYPTEKTFPVNLFKNNHLAINL